MPGGSAAPREDECYTPAGMVCSSGPERVRWLQIQYVRTVAGVVQATRIEHTKGLGAETPADYRVKVGGRWYSVTECDFKKLGRGKPGSFTVPSWPVFSPCR